ncbi:hypothetical protein BDP55DRAFT_729646 [Colletotrichum godetiae]|uniref:Geminivirus AL1 replication-associated protein central domain-containing protein n=1 Tax=Colletotrichum godetiae TaxID=1209918 RepID=A0AAJ0ALJ6_9PEZI|nr:uncharacterized protein BDP55DRAFT_729646 [Colletotrichum godetiae]KAK1674638.1 hypothetical protein BDP55DRAFT_729646 [Colletotrichum godetiae]
MEDSELVHVLYDDVVTPRSDDGSSEAGTADDASRSLDSDIDPENGEGTEGLYLFHGRYVMVTYNRSQVGDHEKFFEYLTDSLQAQMPALSGDKGSKTVEFSCYGAMELHKDGSPHYHVVFAFSDRIHWKDARRKFSVWIPVEGKEDRVVDTTSIQFRPRKKKDSVAVFLGSTQAYCAKEGNKFIFGNRIPPEVQSSKRKAEDDIYREAIASASYEEAKTLFETKVPRDYVRNYCSYSAFLNSKKLKVAVPHKANFKVNDWAVPEELLQWKAANFDRDAGGRPVALIIRGPARCGKTEWAMSFGKPAEMTHSWCVDALSNDCTHLVLNDIDVKGFKRWREFLGGQRSIVVSGKYRHESVMEWGKPTIWTCNKDNDPRKDKHVREYLKNSPVVVVDVKKPLFLLDS